MDIIRKEYTYRSYSDIGDIFARSWAPANPNEIKGIFQITHGMAEHGERYEDFANFLCHNGFVVYCNDHIGHGKSVVDDSMLGYFGKKCGWISFVEDVEALTDIATAEHPNLPVCLFGHSMGSFVARSYMRKYGNKIDKAIICGTSGSNPAVGAGILLTKIIIKLKGEKHRSELINKIAFGSYNNKFKPARTAFDWLTRDKDIVDKYVADKYCGFLFTARGYLDMFSILADVSKDSWYNALNKELPVLLIAGSMDPVGAYSKGVKEVYDKLKATGHKDVTLKLYADARHEILNEADRITTYNDIVNWVKK
ncbi:MAG: alpha/beta hydrolase [Clostridia bacterium]|nr:alpha/beta hydrolase [Clostridia bacterium]